LIKKNSICRTKPDIDKEEYQGKISKFNYYYISKKVREFIISNKVNELPVNLEEIILKNKWYMFSYSEIKKFGNLDEEILKNDWGLTVLIKGTYLILFDDSINEVAKRFTLAHEIGHIVLNHFGSNVKKDIIETEANMFAARLLMPICVLYECNVTEVKEIQSLCLVSNVAAQYRFERLQKLKLRNKFYTDKKEKNVYNLFKNFISNYNRENSKYPNL